jgi:hypothetical protein
MVGIDICMRFKEFMERQGIITAQNPMGQKASNSSNEKANRELAKDLSGSDPKKIKGSYNGNKEDAFVVPRVSKPRLLALGKKYGQKAVVWGGNEILP